MITISNTKKYTCANYDNTWSSKYTDVFKTENFGIKLHTRKCATPPWFLTLVITLANKVELMKIIKCFNNDALSGIVFSTYHTWVSFQWNSWKTQFSWNPKFHFISLTWNKPKLYSNLFMQLTHPKNDNKI